MRVNKSRVLALEQQQNQQNQEEAVRYEIPFNESRQIVTIVMVFKFRNISKEQILKVLHQGDIAMTKETVRGNINFIVRLGNRNVLFVNNYEHKLLDDTLKHPLEIDEDSPEEDKAKACDKLARELKLVTLTDIQAPLEEDGVDGYIDSLTK